MTFTDTFAALADVSRAFAPPPADGLDDASLLDAQRALGEIRRRVDAAAAVVAAEIAHRSRPELGYDGLAQRLGARTPAILVQQVTGSSSREAQALVRVGSLMESTSPLAVESPWLAAVSAAVSTGALSVEAAEVIRVGLGIADTVTVAELTAAAVSLVAEAPRITLERLAILARSLRAALDLGRVAERENELRERRFLRFTPLSDGMTRVTGLLDPESAAHVVAAYDAATSPRRGGPRFVDPKAVDRSERILRDTRTTDQIAVDTFVELIKVATAADPGTILGHNRPSVQVLVTAADLAAGLAAGHGFGHGCGEIVGQTTPVSIETVSRHVCDTGTLPLLFDNKQVMDVGRDQRLHNRAQRRAIAARDGGCIFPGCGRPPSWTEVHHIVEWKNGGTTSVEDGVLLCKHHHLLVHNNHWRITRNGTEYFVVPPATIDPRQVPIPAQRRGLAQGRLAS